MKPRFEHETMQIPAHPFHVIAHRGASAYAPENTMAAFERAFEMGAPEVETDVAFTKDRHLLLFHDDTLERTTNGHGSPEDFTHDELKQLDAGSWHDERLAWDRDYKGERLITLPELLDRFGKALTYHLEIKKPTAGLVTAIIDCVRARDLIDHVFIATIDDEASLREAMRLAPSIRVSLAPNAKLEEFGAAAIDDCAKSGYTMVTLSSWNHSADLVERAHALGLVARSSGISNRAQMIEAVEVGCNGMTINWPDWLLDYLRKETSAAAYLATDDKRGFVRSLKR